MAYRVLSIVRRNTTFRIYFIHRFKSASIYTGPGTGLCAVQFHSSTNQQADSVVNQFDWIQKKAPKFQVSGEQVIILPGPVEYFEELKHQAQLASKRIVLAALYLGTSSQVQELVDKVYQACQESRTNPDKSNIQVHVHLDCTRGSRGTQNSRTMLLPLLQDFPGQTGVTLYHTPDLRGKLKELIPERYNEVIGLSHIKAYIFDDTVIMSGANLSESYFTNRQDRYIMVKDCPQLADFFHKLVSTVSKFSFQLKQDNSLELHPAFDVHPYQGDIQEFKSKARTLVEEVINPQYWDTNCQHQASIGRHTAIDNNQNPTNYHHDSSKDSSHKTQIDNRNTDSRTKPTVITKVGCQQRSLHTGSSITTPNQGDSLCNNVQSDSDSIKGTQSDLTRSVQDTDHDTWIFPLVQMGPLGVSVDEAVTSKVLSSADSNMECYLASGYFNLTRKYMDIVLRSRSKFNILMASPQVNGFYGAKGISGYVPDSYTYIAKKFCEKRDAQGQKDRIDMYEYYKDKWTFHAKGLWMYQAGQKYPFLTLMGSPNFGHRSVHRDLEAQLAIVTTNENLQKQLHQEQERLYKQSEKVDKTTYEQEHRKVPLWVKIVSITTRNFW